jgi:hypothetical protein
MTGRIVHPPREIQKMQHSLSEKIKEIYSRSRQISMATRGSMPSLELWEYAVLARSGLCPTDAKSRTSRLPAR